MPSRAQPANRMGGLKELKKELAARADPDRALNLAWFFKTAKGQYGHGDRFIGITVPVQRQIARRYWHLSLDEIARLLESRIHEHRFTALEILVYQYEAGDAETKRAIFDFYLKNTSRVNNWDLVDTSAPYIVGDFLLSRSRDVLVRLAKSAHLWERRIAIVATQAFIREGDVTIYPPAHFRERRMAERAVRGAETVRALWHFLHTDSSVRAVGGVLFVRRDPGPIRSLIG
jgi:hypothetical protein